MSKKPVETQAIDLICDFLALPPAGRLEAVDATLAACGLNDQQTLDAVKVRDTILKALAKVAPVHDAIAHQLLRANTWAVRVNELEQMRMFPQRDALEEMRAGGGFDPVTGEVR